MKKIFSFLFVLSVLLIWIGSSNRQLILNRNPLVFWVIFLAILVVSVFMVYTYFREFILQKSPGKDSRIGNWLVWLMILTSAFTFTLAIHTPLDYFMIQRSKKNTEEKILCDITYFRSTPKPDKRFLKFIFRDKKYRKFISMEEARKLNPAGDPYKGKIELVLCKGLFGTYVIQSYEIRPN